MDGFYGWGGEYVCRLGEGSLMCDDVDSGGVVMGV